MTEAQVFAERALLPNGWARNVLFEIDPAGNLRAVTPDAPPGDAARAAGTVIPGMPNLHSHAFQRAMAGLTERASPGDDSFWTWRAVMYDFVGRLSPEQVEAIASQLYIEMLKSGFTAVGEFHYLHHAPDGRPYDRLSETSQQIISAARRTGIALTHLPVLYGFGGFGGQPAGEGQRRFLNDPDRFARLLEELAATTAGDPQTGLGMALHSLRAVTPEYLTAGVAALDALDPTAPIHIHVSEQKKEVDDCLAWSSKRPVEWLLDAGLLDARWCLVHATHVTEAETVGLARSGAVAGLCPTTEANLGDGIFPAPTFLAAGGTYGIGSDCHISVSPIEDLRWLEYGQRLITHQRNHLNESDDRTSVGASLYDHALRGGNQALGLPGKGLETGARADLLVLDPDCPALFGREGDMILDAMIFSGNANPVRDVMAGGKWVIREGHHEDEAAALEGYRNAVNQLLA